MRCWIRPLGLALLALSFAACGENPERLLLGRWQEVEWRYEMTDLPAIDPANERAVKWKDGVKFPKPARELERHEAEYWEFRPGRVLVIAKKDGRTVQKRWRLKGRGHILTLRSPDGGDLELYDVKELDRGQLILNYDIGMEVRGVARLVFGRLAPTRTTGATAPRANPSTTSEAS